MKTLTVNRNRRTRRSTGRNACSKLIAGLLLLIFGHFPVAALADSGGELYYGLQYAAITYEEDDVPDLEPDALVFRIGMTHDDVLAYEGRIGAGLSASDETFDDPFIGRVNFEIEFDHLLGAYLLARTDLGSAFSVYGILGFTRVEATASIETIPVSGSVTDSESGLSFGFGANIGSFDRFRFNIEYMSYLDESEFSIEAVSIGVQF